MGLLDLFRRKPAAPAARRDTAAPAREKAPRHPSLAWQHETPPAGCIAGESHHASGFAAAVGRRRERGYLQPVDVTLVREPENAHDSNAIRAEISGSKIGYIVKDVAADLAPQMDQAGAAQCVVPGIVRDGTSVASARGAKPHRVEVWLDRLRSPAGLALTSHAAKPSRPWPPRAWEGQTTCPGCGGFAWMREVSAGAFTCDRCGEAWRG